ncbi:MAG: glycerol kinase GlpK [bacterium]
MTRKYILAIDQGTTSSRAIVFDADARVVATAQEELPQVYPADGCVEHDPEVLWSTVLRTARQAVAKAEADGGRIVAIGIANQRETTVVWDRSSGKPIHNAIVWQDRRTANTCKDLADSGLGPDIRQRTGLVLDPYFSATKIAWILDHVDGARKLAVTGKLAFGTIDTFLISRLTGNREHVTDVTNAARTSLFNINDLTWDETLLKIFNIPAAMMPKVLGCTADFGQTAPGLFGRAIPILGVAGDQQAAAIGQCCFDVGAIKSTYGTGCFVLVNTGDRALTSRNRLLTTIAYRINGKTTYALEGSIFSAGAAVQWLRDGLRLISCAAETEELARQAAGNGNVYMVPALTGLGAPYWRPDVRGAFFGINRSTGRAELVRAALESACYLTHDLLAAMVEDGVTPSSLRVDGGMVANNWMMQFLADILNLPVNRPEIMETTALGAAYLAGIQSGMLGTLDNLPALWRLGARFEPRMVQADRQRLLDGWHDAVQRVIAGPKELAPLTPASSSTHHQAGGACP